MATILFVVENNLGENLMKSWLGNFRKRLRNGECRTFPRQKLGEMLTFHIPIIISFLGT